MDIPHAAEFLAVLIHESGRSSVTAGDTLAHATAPAQTRPFVEWPDLPHEVQRGRRLTAANILNRFHVVAEPFPDLGSGETVESFAAALHESEREAVDHGLVLVKLNRPWVHFGDLPTPAQDGRRRQAKYLLDRFFVVEK